MSDENGLVYMRARYYSPTFKRFINADVVAGSITNAITLNRYAYANGNPVSNVDPFGLSADNRGTQGDYITIQEPMEGKSESAIDQTVPNQSSKSNTLDILNVVFNSLSKIISPAIFRTLYDYLIYSNYCSNIKNENSKSTTTHNEYVHGQRNHKYEGFKYGFFNASYNSCEVIAIHNVKVYLGIDTTLPDTIKDIQLLGGMWLYGVFGSYPHITQRAFDYYEIDYTKIDSMSDMTENGMYLLTYCKDANLLNGIHTVAVEHKNDKYMAYNLYGSTADVDEFEVSDYENGFICGYFVGQNN